MNKAAGRFNETVSTNLAVTILDRNYGFQKKLRGKYKDGFFTYRRWPIPFTKENKIACDYMLTLPVGRNTRGATFRFNGTTYDQLNFYESKGADFNKTMNAVEKSMLAEEVQHQRPAKLEDILKMVELAIIIFSVVGMYLMYSSSVQAITQSIKPLNNSLGFTQKICIGAINQSVRSAALDNATLHYLQTHT